MWTSWQADFSISRGEEVLKFDIIGRVVNFHPHWSNPQKDISCVKSLLWPAAIRAWVQPIPFDRFMNAQKRNGRVEYLNRSNTLVYSTLKSKERLVCVCYDLVHFGPHNRDKTKYIRKWLIFLLSHLCWTSPQRINRFFVGFSYLPQMRAYNRGCCVWYPPFQKGHILCQVIMWTHSL